ncbi:MAG: methyltransferase domain-containing protein [Steroidobacteraceae bacterium]|nr:methyltransferase domain-containing protein [Steroidobacteraceae bacterium]
MPTFEGLAPAPTNFFMTIRDVAYWVRSARADARLDRLSQEGQAGSAFDDLYADTHDPFGVELPQYRYQQRKYACLLSMLPNRRYRNILDIGCGLGTFTRKLAPFGERVLGTDISGEAIRQATRLSAGHPNVSYLQRDMLEAAPQESAYDLIIIADTLYYVKSRSPAALKLFAGKIASILTPDGLVLVVNHYFFGIDLASRETRGIHDAFRSASGLDCMAEFRRAFFLATLLQRAAS